MRVVVLQSNYLPWKGYFDLIQSADCFIYYDEVQYTKNDWRNRNVIYSKNGLHWITVPIHRNAVKLKISEVTLDDIRWQDKHYKSVEFAYRGAPYFHQIQPLLEDIYRKHTWTHLSPMNRYITETISSMLGLRTEFLNSKDFDLEGERVHRLVSLLKQVGATEYLTGPSARTYLAGYEHLFEDAGIGLTYKSYEGYAVYPQLREPFVHAVSIIDVMVSVPLGSCRHYITAGKA